MGTVGCVIGLIVAVIALCGFVAGHIVHQRRYDRICKSHDESFGSWMDSLNRESKSAGEYIDLAVVALVFVFCFAVKIVNIVK